MDAIKILLLNWNARVMTATSKSELQQVLSASKNDPDFLIADFQFEPSFSGEEVIRCVRERFDGLLCAIMTGNLSLVSQHIFQLERTHIFAKPVSAAKLRSLLHFNLLLSPDALPDEETQI